MSQHMWLGCGSRRNEVASAVRPLTCTMFCERLSWTEACPVAVATRLGTMHSRVMYDCLMPALDVSVGGTREGEKGWSSAPLADGTAEHRGLQPGHIWTAQNEHGLT